MTGPKHGETKHKWTQKVKHILNIDCLFLELTFYYENFQTYAKIEYYNVSHESITQLQQFSIHG